MLCVDLYLVVIYCPNLQALLTWHKKETPFCRSDTIMKYSVLKITILIIVVLVAPAFASQSHTADNPYKSLPVFVSIQPQAYFVKRIEPLLVNNC